MQNERRTSRQLPNLVGHVFLIRRRLHVLDRIDETCGEVSLERELAVGIPKDAIPLFCAVTMCEVYSQIRNERDVTGDNTLPSVLRFVLY